MCCCFYIDINILWLLCIYYGLGMLWVCFDVIDYQKVVKGINEEMVKDFDGVFQVGIGEVLLIKGVLYE